MYIYDAIKSIYALGDNKPTVDITTQIGSSSDYKTNNVKLSLPDVIGAYDNLNELSNIPIYYFVLDKGYGDYSSDKSIIKYVEVPSGSYIVEQEITNLLEGTYFINEDIITSKDICTIYSMAYSLYHEIGHLIHDKYIPETEQIKRELVADMFAFRAIKSFEKKQYEETIILGTFIGVTHIFERTTPQIEKEDGNHPYTVDRIVSCLNFWKVQDESLYWVYAYKIFKKWWKKTSLDRDNNSSNSSKEIFMKASLQFKKWVNTIEY